MKKLIFAVAILFYFTTIDLAVSQDNKEIEKHNYRAEKLMRIRNYKDALKEFQGAVELGDQSALTHYNIGYCYIQQPELGEQVKAIPYFEFAEKAQSKEVPKDIYFYLGQVYHKDLEITKALDSYQKYKKLLDPRHPKVKEVDREIEICNNALQLLTNRKSNIIIKNLGEQINTSYTEYNSVVSADETILAFTRLKPNEDKKSSGSELIEEIHISHKSAKDKNWDAPKPLTLETKFNVGTAGLTPDGQTMIIFIGGVNNTGNLYTLQKNSESWSTPVTMGDHINSNYMETTASITPDGKTIYFASNRPGGHGGLDIYMIQKEGNGWSYAKNLGPKINTASDEDAPFIHPDQKTLFFTSDGHNTMGGNDIFKTVLQGGKWIGPVNMGFPINTPANDNYFTLTADGSFGYLSSDRKGGYGGQDIYSFRMPESDANIPLTLIKGRILDAETKKPVPTEIKVIDNETSEKIQYVYNPNPETGNYLIIFPPGKNYDMIIESTGYMPYTININIPNQTRFYELFQEITLKAIKHFEVVVGQEVSVKNVFFDTGNEQKVVSARKANEAMLVKNDSLDLYDLMDAIISAQDSGAYEYLLELMYETNPVDEVDFDKYQQEEELEHASRTYYYDESDTAHLEMREVDGEIIYSLPTLKVTEEDQKRRQQHKEEKISYNQDLLDPIYKVYFEADKSELKENYKEDLKEVMLALNKYNVLGIEISGYASSDGDPEYNRKLSNQRAIEVLNYFNHKGVVRRRIKAKGYGATENKNLSKEEGRRVEIKIIDLNNYTM